MQDDPICAAARKDGKIVVNGLWVDHSFDMGMAVNPNPVSFSCVTYICLFIVDKVE